MAAAPERFLKPDSSGKALMESMMLEALPLLFDATDGNSPTYRRLLATGRYDEGRLIRKVWPDGEILHCIQPLTEPDHPSPDLSPTLIGRNVVVVGDLSSFDGIMDGWDVLNNAHDETAQTLTFVVPKSSLPQDPFQRRSLFEMFAWLPERTRGANQICVVDDNSPGTPDYVVPSRRSSLRPRRSAYDLFGHTAKPILLYTTSYEYLANEMAACGDFELGECEDQEMDGKPFFKSLKTDVRGRKVVIISGTIDARETMELYYLRRAVALAGALACEVVASVWSYGKSDRKTKSGEAVKTKIRARQISSLPPCPLADRILFVDLHSDGTPYGLERGKQHHHVYVAKHLIAAVAYEMSGLGFQYGLGTRPLLIPEGPLPRPGLCAPDIGRMKLTRSVGRDCRLETAYADQIRLPDGKKKFFGAVGDVYGRNLILGDDMTSTGGTLISAAGGIQFDQFGVKGKKPEELRGMSFPDLYMMGLVTHWLCPPEVLPKLQNARSELGLPVFRGLRVANTHPRAHWMSKECKDGYLRSHSIAPILFEELQK
jgi:ribose-phosphate pyrophosphokinase